MTPDRQVIAIALEKFRRAEEHDFHAAKLRREARADLTRLASNAAVSDSAVEKISPVSEAENLSGIDQVRFALFHMGVTYGNGMRGNNDLAEWVVAKLLDEKLNTRQRKVTEKRNRLPFRLIDGKRYSKLEDVAAYIEAGQLIT